VCYIVISNSAEWLVREMRWAYSSWVFAAIMYRHVLSLASVIAIGE
jgi:hypothetical protein